MQIDQSMARLQSFNSCSAPFTRFRMLITNQNDFDSVCTRMAQAGVIAFDTEFVSESYYRPKLCLLQLAFREEVVAVDPFLVEDLTAWWEIMADEQNTILVHGGREEVRFCQFAINKPPQKLIDVQIAEGLRSRGYPLSYTNLVSRVLRHKLQHAKETRTDWERRPLSEQQIEYALDDVRHLEKIWQRQQAGLGEQGRLEWALSECQAFVDHVSAEHAQNGWLKLPGYSRLKGRELLASQELYQWRASVAERQNRPQRRVFRDDMLIEIAKRLPTSEKDMKLIRGMNRRDYQSHMPDLLDVIQRVNDVPRDQLPEQESAPQNPSQDDVLAKILGLALANRCEQLGMSTSLVGTMSDLKQLIRWYVFEHDEEGTPSLLCGWRGEVFGQELKDVLDGKITLRVTDPKSPNPIQFEVD